MKKNYKKICLLLIVLIVSCFVLSGVDAAITINANGDETAIGKTQGVLNDVANGIFDALNVFSEAAASGVFAVFGTLINVLAIAMFLILQMVFSSATGNYTQMPFPDTIVFNRAAFFDANFVNPARGSLTGGMGTVIGNVFASFHTIAIAIFVVAAMITGLKMALSTIASKKAQYKEATMKWLTAFIILLCLKWILAGIFFANEYIVAMLYKVSKSSELKIPIYTAQAIPIFGQLLTNIFKSLENLTGWTFHFEVAGYLGIVVSNLTKGFGGNILSSIVAFIVMGQTFTIIGSYLKRAFMCLILGLVSPLIVAVDAISSVGGKQSTVFSNWLKNFTTTVFMQSFHAMYMVVMFQILAKIYTYNTSGFVRDNNLSEFQVSIISIVLLTGLVKMEKMIKGMFGIGDSMAGDLKDGGKSMMKALGAVKGLGAAAGALKDNVPKMKEASKRKQAYGAELNKLKGAQSSDNSKAAFAAAKKAKAEGNMDEYHRQMKIAAEARKDAKERGVTFDKKGNSSADAEAKTSGSKSGNNNANGDYLQQVINKQSDPANMTRADKIRKLEEGYAAETANFKSAALASIMGPANLAAGIGFGLGMGDDMSETLMKGGFITAALDKGTEKVGSLAADKDRRTFYEHEKGEGSKLGYEASEKIMREKSVVEKYVTEKVIPKNSDGKIDMKQSVAINPVAVGKEIAKQFQGIGEVLSDTMKKELRHIDRDLDDSQ